jgi:heptosyltransferase III
VRALRDGPLKLLFITSNRLGDAVLSTGLLDHLTARGEVAATVACGPVAADLFACLPGLERVLAFGKQPRGKHWFDLWRKVVTRRWDQIVDLRASPLSYLLLAGSRRTLFKAGEGHRVESLPSWYGCDGVPSPRLWSSQEHVARAEDLLGDGPPILGLAPTANWQGKIWPAERFVALAQSLTGEGGALEGARIAVFGGPGEEAAALPLLAGLPTERMINLVGENHLLTVGEALKRCRLVVSNDSGLMHLAAASGAPTLGLFGPSRVEHYAPWGEHTSFVTTDLAYDDLFEPGYDRHTTGSLMTSLGVEKAHRAACDLLGRT